MQHIINAAVQSDLLNWQEGERFMQSYRKEVWLEEREADERADKILRPKALFPRLMVISDPVLGIPLLFWGLFAWLLLNWVVF
jgi:hypothetical protein